MLRKMEPDYLSSKGRLDFSMAEIGDEFYKIERVPYSASISSVQKMKVIRTGKRDVFAVSEMHPKNELRINKEKDFNDLYLEKSEVQWAIDKIILHKKQRKVLDYIDIEKNISELSGDFCDAILDRANNLEQSKKNDKPFFAGAEDEEENGSTTLSDKNLHRPE